MWIVMDLNMDLLFQHRGGYIPSKQGGFGRYRRYVACNVRVQLQT